MMLPSLPSLRSSLLRLHGDILSLEEERLFISNAPSLTFLEKLVVTLEDRRFFSHKGYDIRSIAREAFKAITLKKHGGASTIDAQLFRTVSDRYERTTRRKLREILGARALQYKFAKIDILRIYLNIAYFGTGLKGANEASQSLYGKACDDLNLDEASVIASMLVYPKPRIITGNWQAKVGRRAEYGRLLLRTFEKHLNQISR